MLYKKEKQGIGKKKRKKKQTLHKIGSDKKPTKGEKAY
jgi:hypothetical protein